MDDNLIDLRKEVENIDLEIVNLINRRFEVVKEIGQVKLQIGKAIQDVEQESKQFNNYREWCMTNGLSTQLITNVFQLIITHSKKLQS
jgi:chorismate mutase